MRKVCRLRRPGHGYRRDRTHGTVERQESVDGDLNVMAVVDGQKRRPGIRRRVRRALGRVRSGTVVTGLAATVGIGLAEADLKRIDEQEGGGDG